EAQRVEAEKARNDAERARNETSDALYQSIIAQSQLHWRLNDFPGAVRALKRYPGRRGGGDARGWEWHYLDGLYSSELQTLRHERGGGPAGGVAVCPQGRWIASVVAGEGVVRLWGYRDGTPAAALPASPSAQRLMFRPDGAHLAVGDGDGT